MSRVYKWVIRGALALALGATVFACGCPSPCSMGIPCGKTFCKALSPKNIVEDVVIANILD